MLTEQQREASDEQPHNKTCSRAGRLPSTSGVDSGGVVRRDMEAYAVVDSQLKLCEPKSEIIKDAREAPANLGYCRQEVDLADRFPLSTSLSRMRLPFQRLLMHPKWY